MILKGIDSYFRLPGLQIAGRGKSTASTGLLQAPWGSGAGSAAAPAAKPRLQVTARSRVAGGKASAEGAFPASVVQEALGHILACASGAGPRLWLEASMTPASGAAARRAGGRWVPVLELRFFDAAPPAVEQAAPPSPEENVFDLDYAAELDFLRSQDDLPEEPLPSGFHPALGSGEASR